MGSINIKSGGAWRTGKGVHVKASGAWQAAKEVWVRSGGIWRKAWIARNVSIYLSDYQQVASGFGGGSGTTYYDRLTFSVQVSDGAVPTSYSWSGSAFSASSTAVFEGPSYSTNGFTYQSFGQVWVTVTVAGQTYEASYDFQYTAGDAL
jgi:hypothetical protein